MFRAHMHICTHVCADTQIGYCTVIKLTQLASITFVNFRGFVGQQGKLPTPNELQLLPTYAI